MARLDHMVRGHVSQQSFQFKRRGQTITQGPYLWVAKTP
jgi:hypothetical protein